MRVKIYKSDWEDIGKTAGWLSDTVSNVSDTWESIAAKVKSMMGMPIDPYAEEKRILREDTRTKTLELKKLIANKSKYEKLLNQIEGWIKSGKFDGDANRKKKMEDAAIFLSIELEKIGILQRTIEANIYSIKT